MDSDLDVGAVAAWASGRVAGLGTPLKATRLAGGQSNPTYRLESAGGAWILRRKPHGNLLKSAHAVDREFRVQRALADTAVPVPRMHALCEDESVIGAAFYIMDEVKGRSFEDPALPELDREERSGAIDSMNRVLAQIHDVDIEAVGLSDFGPPGHYCARQTDRWTRQYRASQTEDIPEMEALIGWLERSMPPDDGQRRLVHGDYRIDNLLFAKGGAQVVAALDWELSTIGHPFADLAAVLMQWSMPHGDGQRGLAGVDREALGLWSDARFADAYCERRGLPGIDNLPFYLAFCNFRMAAILQGVKRRGLDGNAADPARAAELGALVPVHARAGLAAASR